MPPHIHQSQPLFTVFQSSLCKMAGIINTAGAQCGPRSQIWSKHRICAVQNLICRELWMQHESLPSKVSFDIISCLFCHRLAAQGWRVLTYYGPIHSPSVGWGHISSCWARSLSSLFLKSEAVVVWEAIYVNDSQSEHMIALYWRWPLGILYNQVWINFSLKYVILLIIPINLTSL